MLSSSEKSTYSPAERANRLILLERLGLLYRSSQQFAEAAQTFSEMATLDPEYGARSAAQIVDTWRQARDYTRAAAEAEAAYKKYPNDRTVALVRASILADLGKVQQAVAETKKLLNGKGDREVWLSLAQIHEKAKDYKEMGQALEEAEKLSLSGDEKETVHFMRGAMYERSKNYEAAETEFRKVLQLDPDNAAALNYLGYMFADRSVRLEEAQKLIAKALEIEPHNGAYLDSLGWVYYRMEKLDEAEDCLRRALVKIPKDPTINDHLGDVFARRGRLKEAVTQWSIALKEWEANPPSERDPAEMAKIAKKLEGAKIRLAQESPAPPAKRP
jgi:tetratricopeptide (TPR) repeat protein